MAELDVQPKRHGAWWLWLLIVIFLILAACLFFKGCGTSHNKVVATTLDWNSVDLNAGKLTDADVTDTDIMVSGTDKYTIYSLGENILFAVDDTTLQNSANAKLEQITASLNKNFKGAEIGVFGNTDSTGTAGHNQHLGAERALAVKKWLVKVGGFDEAKISIHSEGESKPVANNATAAGRQKNRNVEIVVFK